MNRIIEYIEKERSNIENLIEDLFNKPEQKINIERYFAFKGAILALNNLLKKISDLRIEDAEGIKKQLENKEEQE